MNCQKCRTPLKLDSSLENISTAAFNLLAEATAAAQKHTSRLAKPSRPLYSESQERAYEEASQNAQTPVFTRTVPNSRHVHAAGRSDASTAATRENPAMSFVMLTESQLVPSAQSQLINTERSSKKHSNSLSETSSPRDAHDDSSLLSQRMETATKLFELLSSRSDIDHPICTECTEMLIGQMEQHLSNATQERDAFIDFLRKANANVPSDEEQLQAQKELKGLRTKEEAAYAALQSLERERNALDEEIAALDGESHQLDKEEEQFWRERNAFTLTLTEAQNERDSIDMKYELDSRQLARLQRTNVYNDTFCISYDGNFVTINGLRLGRLAAPTVEWAEINAAWGQTCLLLVTVAEKLSFNFHGYRLNPMGSTSTIDRIERSSNGAGSQASKPTVTTLDLFWLGDLPVSLTFLHRSFDSAMVAFLECVRQLGTHIERSERGQKLPYIIRKDKIGDVSIKLGGFSQEDWTRACKYTLTCCKYLLAHASNPSASGRLDT